MGYSPLLGNTIKKFTLLLIFCISLLNASNYKALSDKLNLSQTRYWNLLLHNVDGVSEIDDPNFFFAKDGKTNAKNELHATLDAMFNETRFDDNSSACRFPARKAWLQKKLNIQNFPKVECKEYDKVLNRLLPQSATLVFASAHINSPASMFGHTFLRINSSYKSRLLSYAINYAASVDADKTNAIAFAIGGLSGSYYGKYSLLPYYEKLKEYKDTEQRDIWEYDLDLNEEETLRMVQHIWELNGTNSYYYFFTENCSYNMLWLIEVARESLHLREHFNFQVIPLETAHILEAEGIIKSKKYRPSKRTILLKYEKLIDEKNLHLVRDIIDEKIKIDEFIKQQINIQQKQYILEASIEFLEYSFTKNSMKKEKFLKLFHTISKTRASLGKAKKINIKTPPNPINGHRAIRANAGFGFREGKNIQFLGIRPAYHDIQDSSYGFLRGTQIEFGNLELSYSQDKLKIEEATILSIVSLAQRSEFFKNFSWRTKFGFDKNSLKDDTNFIATLGAGYSWGNKDAYVYLMADPLFYASADPTFGLGFSAGLVFDKFKNANTNIELTNRFYDNDENQWLIQASQNFRLSQNIQLKFMYDYKQREDSLKQNIQRTARVMLNYYF